MKPTTEGEDAMDAPARVPLLEQLTDMFWRSGFQRASIKLSDAKTALLNWCVETADLLTGEAKQFYKRHGLQAAVTQEKEHPQVTVKVHSHTYLPALGDQPACAEQASSLVYSLHPNGTVAVIAYPHFSGHQKQMEGAPFVLDVATHPRELAGAAGKARVRQHLRLFTRFAIETRAHMRPDLRTMKLVRKIEARAHRYRFVYESAAKAREERQKGEVTLGAGVIAGLLAGTVVPLVQQALKTFGILREGPALVTVLAAVLLLLLGASLLYGRLLRRR